MKLFLLKKWKMVFSRLFRKDSIVGIDLGSSSIKMAQLVRRADKLVLVKLALKEMTLSEEGAAKDQEILAVLRELLEGVERKQSRFVVCFNSPENGVRVLTVPSMSRQELAEAVRLESKNYFPYSIDDSILEIESCGEVMEGAVKKQRTLVAVAPREKVNEILELMKKAGIRPASLLPIPCALGELVESTETMAFESRCLLDIGERHTEFTIFKGKQLVFSRQIPIAGRDFTQAMTGVLVSDRGKVQLSLEEAERVKREFGIPSEGESELIRDKISTSQLVSLLRSPVELLTSEIDRCFDYYREKNGGERVDAIELFGRGASLKGLSEALSRELGLEVKVGNPFAQIKIEAQLVSPDMGSAPFAAAMGAALSEGKGGVNLLPPLVKQETERALKRAALQSVGIATALLLAFIYIGMRIQLGNYQKKTAVAKMELASLGLNLVDAREKIVAYNVRAVEPYWEDVFKEISHLIPPQVVLTELDFRDHKLVLKGRITSKENDAILSDFILSLEKGLFKNVRLVLTKETEDKSANQFEIECGFD